VRRRLPAVGGRWSVVGGRWLGCHCDVGPSPVVEGGVFVMLLTAITRRRSPATDHWPSMTSHRPPITGHPAADHRPPITASYLAYAGSKLNLLATKSLTRE
jgi:hypothetical protein